MLWGRGQKCKALAARFVAAVNAHDADAMRALVTDDFTYIDSWREGVPRNASFTCAGAGTAFDGSARTVPARDGGLGQRLDFCRILP